MDQRNVWTTFFFFLNNGGVLLFKGTGRIAIWRPKAKFASPNTFSWLHMQKKSMCGCIESSEMKCDGTFRNASCSCWCREKPWWNPLFQMRGHLLKSFAFYDEQYSTFKHRQEGFHKRKVLSKVSWCGSKLICFSSLL